MATYRRLARQVYIDVKTVHLAKNGIVGYQLSPRLDKPEYWTDIVRFSFKNQLHLERMILTRFEFALPKDCVPPSSIPVPKYLPAYLEANKLSELDIQYQLKTEKQVYRDYVLVTVADYGYKGADRHRFALRSMQIRVSPLFRYCLARNLNLPDIVDQFKQRAMFQYLMSPKTYNRYWREWIPSDLREFAKRFEQRIKGEECEL